MDKHEKAKLARQGLEAAELLEPGKIKQRVKDSVSETASNAALRGLAAIGRLTGADSERSPARARAAEEVDVNRTFAAIEADDIASFERNLREASARKARTDVAQRLDLVDLRRSFPEASQELALLIFNCVDLLDELSADAEGRPPTNAAELERKERLLTRIAELIAPRAGEALLSFVRHVVDTSRRYRSE